MATEIEGSSRPAPVAGRLSKIRASGAASEHQTWLIVAGLALLALALHMSQINQSLLGDEGFTYSDIVGHSLGAVLTTVHAGGENSPPLFFVLSWAAIKLGNPSIWLRLPSVLLGAATIPVLYAIARETVGRGAGLIACALWTLSPFLLFYGVEARPYATMMFCVAVCTLALMRAVRTGAARWWALYAAAAAAAAYSHYTCIFVLAVQAVWSLWACRGRIGPALAGNVTIALLYIPWLPHVRGKELAVIAGLERLNAHNVLTDLIRASFGYPFATPSQIPTVPGLILCILALATGAVFFARGRPGQRDARANASSAPANAIGAEHLGLLTALTLATPMGLLLYSVSVTDLWLARGLSASLPAAVLLAGALLSAPPRPAAAGAVAVVLVVLGLGTIRALGPSYRRGPFRDVASYLDRTAQVKDPIIYVSLLAPAVTDEQLRRPHRFIPYVTMVAHPPRPHTPTFMVLDDTLAHDWHNYSPRMPGLHVLSRHHFPGLFPTDVLTYGAAASPG